MLSAAGAHRYNVQNDKNTINGNGNSNIERPRPASAIKYKKPNNISPRARRVKIVTNRPATSTTSGKWR